nr:MAG TPA: hypothetical protein [Caudoviricetes sp.]
MHLLSAFLYPLVSPPFSVLIIHVCFLKIKYFFINP